MKIYRYELEITDRQQISMPEGARVLSVASRGDGAAPLHMWALVDPNAATEGRDFVIIGTGNPTYSWIGDTAFVGTCVQSDLVWHVFEVTK